MGESRHLRLMCHEQDCDPGITVEVSQQFHDLERAFGIEIAGRLVGEQHVGMGHDRPRDRYALLLSAGKLAGRMIGPARQPDLVERCHRHIVPFLF